MPSLRSRRMALQSLAVMAGLPGTLALTACASMRGGTGGIEAAPLAPSLATPSVPADLVLPTPARADLPSLVLIGDSTVRNGRDDGQGLGPLGQWGWGHALARHLRADRVNLVNRAIGGLSSRTYRSGGHWQRTQAYVGRGDVVLMQFGHNDASPVNDASRARGTLRGTGPETELIDNLLTGQRETVATYGAYLRRYVADIRALGAVPVICTPVPRRRFDAQGRAVRSPEAHAGWARRVAQEEGVPCIDLDTLVCDRWDALGAAVVEQLFPRHPEDRTHTNGPGAALNARCVRDALQALRLLPAEAYVPGLPPAVAASRLPRLVLVGDSTVRTGGANPGPQGGQWGWGERLGEWLQPERVQLLNHAMAGRSSRTFLREGRWDTVRALLQPGDTVLLQFGHNDVARVGDPAGKQRGSLPGIGPDTAEETLPDGSRETVRSFGAYLSTMLRDCLAAGAVPIVLSPIPHKDRWQEGRDFAEHAAWGEAVARREGALFIDYTALVTQRYRQLGAAAVEPLYADARTHTSDAGARVNAAVLAAALRGLPQAYLSPFVRESLPAGA